MRLNLNVVFATCISCYPIWAHATHQQTQPEQRETLNQVAGIEANQETRGEVDEAALPTSPPASTHVEVPAAASEGIAHALPPEQGNGSGGRDDLPSEVTMPSSCLDLDGFNADTGFNATAEVWASSLLPSLPLLVKAQLNWSKPGGAASCISPENEKVVGDFLEAVSNQVAEPVEKNNLSKDRNEKHREPPP